MTKTNISAIYLASILFLWRFQIGVGSSGAPAYLLLSPLVLYFGVHARIGISVLAASFVIVAATLVAIMQGVEQTHGVVALVALLSMLISWLAIGEALLISKADNWRTLATVIRFLIRIQLAIQVAEIIGLHFLDNRPADHYYLPIIRPPGLSIEPSHVAITWSPLIFSSLWSKAKSWGGHLTRVDYALVYLILFLCPSATLLLVFGLAVFMRVSIGRPYLGVFAFVVVLLLAVDYEAIIGVLPSAIASRVDALAITLSTDDFDMHSNLSAVVFYGGYKAMMTTLRVHPCGVGFLNMDSVYQSPQFASYMSVTGGINAGDGSSLLFKTVTEFGYLGIAFLLTSVYSLWATLTFRKPADITICVLLFSLLAYFTRGASYLDGPVMIALAVAIFGPHRMSGSPLGLMGNGDMRTAA